jgi:Rad3-related DNA helicase
MWSLYQKNEGKDEFLAPLVFSNGKTQEDVVKEVVDEIKKGTKVIFIKGVCGTGKSSIALNVAKEIGRASIVVPIKTLQKQYEEDYTNKKYLLKGDQKMKIKIITGRQNHKCPYIKEEGIEIEKIEKNTTLADLGMFDKKNFGREDDDSCDNPFLPCRIDIKERNFKKIRGFLKKNKKVKLENFHNVNNVKRLSIAPVCPYWSPIIPSEISLSLLDDATKLNYKGLGEKGYTIYQRKPGCGYYNQFESYVNADVIIFNSEKYKIETLMNRKPATEIEIIDECDEFLDSLSNQEAINVNKLNFALGSLYPEDSQTNETINETIRLVNKLLKDEIIYKNIKEDSIIPLKETKIFPILNKFLESDMMNFVECDEENYCYHCDEVARTFSGFLNETYVSFYKEEKDLFVRLVTTNLEKRFQELLNKNKVLVLMSGTIHSEKILSEIFGITNFKIIEAETEMPGQITEARTGYELDCRYSNFQNGKINRGQYLFALSRCIAQAKRPVLVHITAFKDLPTKSEAEKYSLQIMTQEEMKEKQKNAEQQVEKFKNGEIDILYTTKCSRGVDFPGETCNSIILTRYPFPNIGSLFWRVLKETRPTHYNDFYVDKSRREFLQKIYRGLRSKEDHIYLLSPDCRVFIKREDHRNI